MSQRQSDSKTHAPLLLFNVIPQNCNAIPAQTLPLGGSVGAGLPKPSAVAPWEADPSGEPQLGRPDRKSPFLINSQQFLPPPPRVRSIMI